MRIAMVFFSVSLLSSVLPGRAANLLTNGGFEEGTADKLPGWTSLGWGESPRRDAAIVHSGRYSLRVPGYGGVASTLVPYHGGRVVVSGWVRTQDVVHGKRPWNKAAFQVISCDAQGNPVGHSDVVLLEGTHDWQRYSATFRYSLNVAFVTIHCHLWGKETRGTAWFDDITLEMPDKVRPHRKMDLEQATVTVELKRDLGEFRHLWIGSDVGYMDRVVSPTQVNAMRYAHRYGFRYVRMHDCIHDPGIYSEGPDGAPRYDWTHFDKRIGAVVDNDMVPVVVLETMPPPLATHDDGRSWTNPYPPRDAAAYLKWQHLVRELVRHCRATWGEGIHEWYFEVWNEPDAKGYFKGTRAEYFRIYDHAVAGAVAADPKIRIGGPGGAGSTWIQAFLQHCDSGANDADGTRGVRLDFLSWHVYTVGVGIPVFDNLYRNLEAVREVLDTFPALKDLPTLITEWGCSSSSFTMHDRPYDAAFRAMAVRAFMDQGITYAFPFALGEGPPHAHEGFQGGLALFTKTTIPKPSFTMFELLHRMRGKRVSCRSSNDPVGGLACVSPAGRTIWVLLYNLIEDSRHDPYSTRVTVALPDLPPGTWKAAKSVIAPGICDPWVAWHKMGEPKVLTPAQRTALLRAATLPPPEPLLPKNNTLRFDMPGFGIAFLELTRH